jgi:Mg2+ and Co2+ transporter CorA
MRYTAITDYAKRELKALDRIAKKISDAESHLTKIEDSIDDKKHRTAQHETIKDIKSILRHARKVDKDEDKMEQYKGEGPKDSTKNHYVYEQEEEPVINDLKKDFNELDDKLAKLNDFNGGDIDAFRTEHHYLEKAQDILKKAGKLN